CPAPPHGLSPAAASADLTSSSATARAPGGNRHCSSPRSAVLAAMTDDLPAPLESFGPGPATTISVPGTVGTGWVDSREMFTACTATSVRSPTLFSVLPGARPGAIGSATPLILPPPDRVPVPGAGHGRPTRRACPARPPGP